MEKIVIVGAGQGGFQAATSLRDEGFTAEIVLIGAEPHLPYQRPPLSKAYLADGNPEALSLRPRAHYDRLKITLILEARAERIDRSAREVVLLDRRIPYDHLILATGARNLRPPLPGLEHALDLRSLDDAVVLRDALSRPRRCAVIGGGFIGLEFAGMARKLGHEVTVAEATPRLMSRVVSPEMSDRFAALHRERGVTLKLGQAAREVDPDGITLDGGERIEADLVLLAAGVGPEQALAQSAGLTCGNGICLDDRLLTDDPDISALGDCAQFPDPLTKCPVRLESVQAAVDQARHVARRLATGRQDRYQAVPWFWSDQAGVKLQIVGLAQAGDESHTLGDVVYRHREGKITAVETYNAPRMHMAMRRIMQTGRALQLRDIEKAGGDPAALVKAP